MAATFVTGCGRPLAQVSGSVTFQDRRLASGTVMAVGRDGVPHYGAIAENGRYSLDAILPGDVIWAVTSPDPNASIVQLPPGGVPPPPPVANGNWFPIPDHYAVTSTSNLHTQLEPGPNRFDLKLSQ